MFSYFTTLLLASMLVSALGAFNRVQDSSDAYYTIGHQETMVQTKSGQEKIPTQCYIQKIQNGKETWKVTYDTTSSYCQGYGIFYHDGSIYAIFKVTEPKNDAGSLRNNVDTDAPQAFKLGLWSDAGTGRYTLDVIACIDIDTGKMLTATYLFSKYVQALLDTASYSIHVSGISLEGENIRVTTKSQAYPPSRISDRSTFIPYLKKENTCAYIDLNLDLNVIENVQNFPCPS